MSAIKLDRSFDEFGDFQTPLSLATAVCRFLASRGLRPATIVEPTCGLGHFLHAALDCFPASLCSGSEINADYAERANAAFLSRAASCRVECESFFDVNWPERLRQSAEPVLVLGNPPWVTNSQLGTIGSNNLPKKSNFQNHVGLDAMTGKSNFDISEWMLIRLLDALAGRRGWLAMLCKTAVARKVLQHAWNGGVGLEWAEIRLIDAKQSFGASVDACLLICETSTHAKSVDCPVFNSLDAQSASNTLGNRDGRLITNVTAYEHWKHLAGEGPYQWRSGIKHDCSKVMELKKEPNGFRNGYGEFVELETDYLFPMLKSSDVANECTTNIGRWMLVPQRTTGQDTGSINTMAPKTWDHLQRHGEAMDRRGSSIYRNRPRFSVFGVGDYAFSPWKVAISGFYKKLQFSVVGPAEGKPVVFDDTVYFTSCATEDEALYLASLLNSRESKEFFSAFISWDAKRPITVDLLRNLDLSALARELKVEHLWPKSRKSLFDDVA